MFVAGFMGGRLDISVGIDTETLTLFAGYSKGGNLDPFTQSVEVAGLQAGAGVGVGAAESSDFVFAPAYVADVDLASYSVSVASNDPVMGERGINPPWTDGSTIGEPDARPRQFEVQAGGGAGASQVKTSGQYVEISAVQLAVKAAEVGMDTITGSRNRREHPLDDD